MIVIVIVLFVLGFTLSTNDIVSLELSSVILTCVQLKGV